MAQTMYAHENKWIIKKTITGEIDI
jgi:hypothetical protein